LTPGRESDSGIFRVAGISYVRIPAEDPAPTAAFIDDALEKIVAHGGEVATAPYPEGDLWVALFRDPAGNVLGVWQRGPRG
jgi:hypothetical protein